MTSAVCFTLSRSACRILWNGSPGAVIEAARGEASYTPGKGLRFQTDRETAEELADYLDSVAGAVADMSVAERAGGTEHRVASRAVARIERAIKEVTS